MGRTNKVKRDNKKNKKKSDKLKVESALLYFLAHNPHESQTKRFLKCSLNKAQYTVFEGTRSQRVG